MLSPKLSGCLKCASILDLLANIDCKLANLSNNLYNNVVFSLNKSISSTAINDLLAYRRILMYKLVNENYLPAFTVNMIASRVKLLTVGANNCCSRKKSKNNSTTTSTTTINNSTTTSSTTIGPGTTTTSTTPVPQQLLPLLLTYADVGGCAASCPLDPITFYAYTTCHNYILTNNAFNILGCVIYQDAAGTQPALNGWYSTQAGLCLIVGAYNNGVISGVTSCP